MLPVNYLLELLVQFDHGFLILLNLRLLLLAWLVLFLLKFKGSILEILHDLPDVTLFVCHCLSSRIVQVPLLYMVQLFVYFL